MKILRTVPVDFLQGSTNPTDRHLFDAVQEFANRELGTRLNLHTQLKVWAAIEDEEVVGLTSIQLVPDVPTFHITRGSDSEEHRERARRARDMLTARLVTYTQDGWGVGKEVHIFVDPGVERLWKSYLRLIKAKPANRIIVTS